MPQQRRRIALALNRRGGRDQLALRGFRGAVVDVHDFAEVVEEFRPCAGRPNVDPMAQQTFLRIGGIRAAGIVEIAVGVEIPELPRRRIDDDCVRARRQLALDIQRHVVGGRLLLAKIFHAVGSAVVVVDRLRGEVGEVRRRALRAVGAQNLERVPDSPAATQRGFLCVGEAHGSVQ